MNAFAAARDDIRKFPPYCIDSLILSEKCSDVINLS